MCDPASLAIASAASTAIGAAGSIAGGIGQMNAQKKQANEVAAWQQQQKKAREAEGVRQENLRQEANAARETSVEQLSGDEQAKRQAEEEARLTTYLQGGDQQATPESTPTSVADAELSGQSQGPEDFRSDLAAKINTATKDARKRMAALATVSSYGDSFGGLGTTNKEILGKSGSAIDMANDLRKGSSPPGAPRRPSTRSKSATATRSATPSPPPSRSERRGWATPMAARPRPATGPSSPTPRPRPSPPMRGRDFATSTIPASRTPGPGGFTDAHSSLQHRQPSGREDPRRAASRQTPSVGDHSEELIWPPWA